MSLDDLELNFSAYARRPFQVEAVMVTVDNLEELAPFIGEVQKKEDGTKFIQVDRRKVPNVFRVYPGFYLTRLDGNIRCYSAKVFFQQFVAIDHGNAESILALNGERG